jgi:radical SAM superfamily enzyme YgiQ (UPF0313 family)
LISPPGELNTLPRGIMEIASFLNKHGLSSSVLPIGYHLQHYMADESGYVIGDINKNKLFSVLKDAIEEINPMVIGVSNLYTKDFPNCIDVIKMCKQIDPRVITVMGGQHVSFCDRESLQTPELDIVVRGEGEWVMLNLLKAISEKEDYSGVRGITFKNNGQILRNPSEPLGNLKDIPPIDFGLLPKDFVQKAYIHGVLYRGCAFHCKYCVEKNFWGKPRSYAANKLIQEMKVLEKEYGTQMRGFEESMLNMRSKPFFDLLGNIKENKIRLPTQFYLTIRIDNISDDGIECMRQTGIRFVCAGIENFSARVLKMMNKQQNLEAVLSGCETLKKNGVWVNAYWLIGHPGDNMKEADYTFFKFKEFLEMGLFKSGHAFIFVPYPGTEYFANPEQYGIKISSYDWKDWRRWTKAPASCLNDFSSSEIVSVYERSIELLDYYRTLNDYLFREFNI